jgi:uncharacterized protein YndB with AHSA1/START domain
MKAIATAIVLLSAAALGLAIGIPDTFEIERAVSINAPPNRVFHVINDPQRWPKWSPWETKQTGPAIKRSYAGASSGKGAVYEWDDASEAVRGRFEIVEATAPKQLLLALQFARPFGVQNIKLDFVPPYDVGGTTEFTIVERGGATVVTWTLRGKYSVADKLKGLAANMTGVLGHELEVGLTDLKTLAES